MRTIKNLTHGTHGFSMVYSCGSFELLSETLLELEFKCQNQSKLFANFGIFELSRLCCKGQTVRIFNCKNIYKCKVVDSEVNRKNQVCSYLIIWAWIWSFMKLRTILCTVLSRTPRYNCKIFDWELNGPYQTCSYPKTSVRMSTWIKFHSNVSAFSDNHDSDAKTKPDKFSWDSFATSWRLAF